MQRVPPRLHAGRARGAMKACDFRALKDEYVFRVRERVLGPQGSMPGDRFFRKPLEGKKLMNWYFPSKYALSDFRLDEYFEMQDERFSPRQPHSSMQRLLEMQAKVSANREGLYTFFQKLDERTFLENPSLQDLYGLFRLVDSRPALNFSPPESVFRDHATMFGKAPSANATSKHLYAVLSILKEKLSGSDYINLKGEIARQVSMEDIEKILEETCEKHNVTFDLKSPGVIIESGKLDEYINSDSSRERESEKESAKAVAAIKNLRLHRRHRFIDPMYRRRRLKWIERQIGGLNKER